MEADWSDPRHVLGVVERLLSVPRPGLYERFSAELATLIPHRATAIQTGDCARSPLAAAGDPAIADAVTSGEMQRLAARAEPGAALLLDGVLGGAVRRLVLLASAPAAGAGSVLVVVPDAPDPPVVARELAARLWGVLSADQGVRAVTQSPDLLAGNLAAAAARAHALADLGQTSATTLTTLLSVLRSGRLGDAAARRTATDLAADALITLRSVAARDDALSAEPANAAFAVLRGQLAPLVRHSDAHIELAGPDADDAVPQDLAHTARTVTRALLLAALERPATTRVRASWRLDGATLHIAVRDDGDGAPAAPVPHLTVPGGSWAIDAVPGWGTTVTATLPLTVTAPDPLHPLDRLHPRELEVLSGIAEGLRNRAIAERLSISEHTVKFHVQNILRKLSVTSRGAAAALLRPV